MPAPQQPWQQGTAPAPQQGAVPAPQQPWQQGTAPPEPWPPGSPQALPQQQWAPTVASPRKPKRKPMRKGVLLGIVGALVLVIALVVVLSVTNARRAEQRAAEEAAASEAAAEAAAQARADAAIAPVEGYLQALADADADAALTFLTIASPSELMTDEVLAASNAIAPITAIEVTPVDPETAFGVVDVAVSYLLGDEQIDITLSVTGPYSDEDTVDWELTGGYGSLYVGDALVAAGGLVNGVQVTSASVDVFFGAYELSVSDPQFGLEGTTRTTVSEEAGGGEFDAQVVLSDEGLAQFRTLVNAAVSTCVASTTLAAGCGIDLPDTIQGTTVHEGTVSRSLSAEAQVTLDSLEADVDHNDPRIVSGEYIGAVDVEFDCTENGQSGRCELLFGSAGSLGSPVVDFGADAPVVRWD
ncbi:hypothetical protein [Occultella gossypii]|uniref:Uncharacterized protein n=1 Tax=Occultella gossypii TaxID=2800820 RepID=A0ABS7SH96_9MICO|nr:hypothetical protein [Occultella gossypii]MBZ2199729.1 hypothetical protein [Occultella gossypii]